MKKDDYECICRAGYSEQNKITMTDKLLENLMVLRASLFTSMSLIIENSQMTFIQNEVKNTEGET